MDERFFRAAFEAIKPDGVIWTAEIGKDLDSFLNALSAAKVSVSDFLSKLADLRRPETTPYLEELERELGVVTNPVFSENKRREYLKALLSRRGSIKNAELLEEILRDVGFDVYVHINNPPVDPNTFIFESYLIVFGNPNAIFGNPNAIFGTVGGELLVNGTIFTDRPIYLTLFGGETAIFGNSSAIFGRFDGTEQDVVRYKVPEDPGYWGLFFFVGGPATRNPDGELINIAAAEIPYARRSELNRLILEYKPLHTWTGLVVKYI